MKKATLKISSVAFFGLELFDLVDAVVFGPPQG
jgi:hypothetical protein